MAKNNTTEPELVAGEKFTAEPESAAGGEITAEPESAAGKTIADADSDEFRRYIDGIKDGYIPDSNADINDADINDDTDAETADNEDVGEDNTAQNGGNAQSAERTFTQADVDAIVKGRLAERSKEDSGRLAALDELGAEAIRFYGGTRDEAIQKMISDLRTQNAQGMGVSEENYAQMRDAENKARLYDEQQREQRDRQAREDEIIKRWEEQSEEMKEIVSDFDFRKAMENDAFRDAIMQGKSVQTAYMLSTRQSEQPKPQRRNIRQNAASKKAVPGKAEFDPTKASDKDFNAYIDKIRRIE